MAQILKPITVKLPHGLNNELVVKESNEYETLFNEKLIGVINELTGDKTWTIEFLLDNTDRYPVWFGYVYAKDRSVFSEIVQIVIKHLIEFRFCCIYKGPIDDYLLLESKTINNI